MATAMGIWPPRLGRLRRRWLVMGPWPRDLATRSSQKLKCRMVQNYRADGSPEGGLNSRDDSHEVERFDHSSRDFEARSLDAITVPVPGRRVAGLPPGVVDALPTLLLTEPERTQGIFYEYFEALNVRNPGTRETYERAVRRFLEWCSDRGVVSLEYVTPIHISRHRCTNGSR